MPRAKSIFVYGLKLRRDCAIMELEVQRMKGHQRIKGISYYNYDTSYEGEVHGTKRACNKEN